jgi:hypothetical protein
MNMTMLRVRLITVGALLCLGLINATPIAAAPGGNGNGNGNNGNGNGNGGSNNPPAVSATPELDSLALFGAGAAGMVGYALMRLRAGRRQGKEPD